MTDTGPNLRSVRVIPASTIAEIVTATDQELASLRAELADLEAAILELEGAGTHDSETSSDAEPVRGDEIDANRQDEVTTADIVTVLARAQETADRRLAEARAEAERLLAVPRAESPTEIAGADEEPENSAKNHAQPPEFWAEMDNARKGRKHRSFRALIGPSIEVLLVIGVFVAVLLRLS